MNDYWILRAGHLVWSRYGWTPYWDMAKPYDSHEEAKAARDDLQSDRDVVPVHILIEPEVRA